MKAWMTGVAAVTVLAGTAAVQAAEATAPAGMTNPTDRVSYSIGVDIARGLTKQGLEIKADAMTQGIRDALGGGALRMTDDEMRQTLMGFQQEMMKKRRDAMAEAGEKNKKDGEAYLAANKGKEGVVTLPSGLQYKILKAGEGAKPTKEDSVECNYRGTLIDGKEFDSSYSRGQPSTFRVGGVIPGWTEALQLMPVGSKWQLFIPSDLAYGPRGAGADIGPNATLVFEVELLGIKK